MKRIISVITAILLLLCTPMTALASSFTDVPSGAYFSAPVMWAVSSGITSGTSDITFSPKNPCTRGQIVTFLYKAYGNGEKAAPVSFTDVKSDKYYYNAVNWAVAKGVASGTGNNTFSPNSPCTRAQAVTFLYKVRGNGAASTSASKFSDVAIGKYYYTPVGWAIDNGVASGTSGNTFSPNATCSRAQIVTFMYNVNKESTGTSYIGNASSKIFHKASCPTVKKMKESNKIFLKDRADAINAGYTPCKICNP